MLPLLCHFRVPLPSLLTKEVQAVGATRSVQHRDSSPLNSTRYVNNGAEFGQHSETGPSGPLCFSRNIRSTTVSARYLVLAFVIV